MYNYYLGFFRLVRQCAVLASWLGLWSNTSLRVSGTYVNYGCETGHRFPDGLANRTTLCQTDGNWSPAIVSCVKGTPKMFPLHFLGTVL